MAKTESAMLPLGTVAPSFDLIDTGTKCRVTLEHQKGAVATIIAFLCNHCPYVKHVNPELVRLADDYANQGVSFIAINSNDVRQYPDDSPENMHIMAKEMGYHFPYLFDETQELAMAYQARCTPDFFVFDHELRLVYRGQLDDSRPGNNLPLTGQSIREVLQALLNHQPISELQKPSVGCNIKWKAGFTLPAPQARN